MPTLLVGEDFQSYSPGAGIPTNFVGDGIVFFPTFEDWTSSPFFGNGTKGFFFYGVIKYISSGFPNNTSVFWEDLKTSDNPSFGGGCINVGQVDLVNFVGPVYCSVDYENDGTISISIAGQPTKFNSIDVVGINFDTWGYKQANIVVGTQTVGGTVFVSVAIDLAINGTLVLSIPDTITNIPVSSTPFGSPTINTWKFKSIGLNGSYLDNLYIYDGLKTIGDFPAPGTPHLRISQGVVEPVKLPSGANVRITQGVIEQISLPSSANIRITQGVIELIRKKSATAGGWKVYEA